MTHSTFRARIERARKQAGLTWRELAKKSGFPSGRALQKWITEKVRDEETRRIERLAKATKTSLYWLAFGDEK